MSGTFENIDVPPTLISFAVTTSETKNIISPEFKRANSDVVLFTPKYTEDGMIDQKSLIKNFKLISKLIKQNVIVSAFSLKQKGIAEAISKMCIGNDIGFAGNENINPSELFKMNYGSIVAEVVDPEKLQEILNNSTSINIGKTTKNRIISIVEEGNPLSFNSRKYQITKYIRVLNQIKMLNLDDKRIISNIIKTRFEKVLKNKDYFSHGFTSLKDTIADLFYCLENITTEEERNSCSEIQDVYNAVKTEFQNQIHDFYSFEWLYTGDYQKFRIAFSNAVSYFSYLHQAKEYLYIFNIVLSKLIVQDNSNFEAVLELFANIYSNKYEKSVLINKETHTLLLQLMKKYQIEISIEYDYLFIRKQMKLLAEALSKNDVKDEVIDYWISV